MNKKGFTLVELLAVLVILSIIMGIAIPNVVATLEKSKKEAYITDAKKFLALAKTELTTKIAKPTGNKIVVVKLSCVNNQDIETDPNGKKYDTNNSFVAVVQKGDVYEYYVTLIADNGGGNYKGIFQAEAKELDKDARLRLVTKDSKVISDDLIKQKVGLPSGDIVKCN